MYRHLFAAAVAALLTACSFGSSRAPSVVVIFVENLSFNNVTCGDNTHPVDNASGFATLCNEAVRFTHAFAPSSLSQATIASVLTARYPVDSGVRHNGAQFVPAAVETASEAALKHGYRTAFFSGGAPVFRKSAINQGFETFDDNVVPSLHAMYRSMSDVFSLFAAWQDSEARHSRFFAAVYLPDLQFIDAPTTNDLGELRASSYKGQVEELDESLASLISQLRTRGLWDNSYVMLVGLNGSTSGLRAGEVAPLDLYGENTHTALFIKPPTSHRQSGMNWKIDANVSLVDVGRTLYDIFGAESENASGTISGLTSISLLPVLKNPDAAQTLDPNRWILSESAWLGQQNLGGGARLSLRKGPLFFLYDGQRKMYDTLVDNLELSPLPLDDERYANDRNEFETYFRKHGWASWVKPPSLVLQKIALGQELWRPRVVPVEALNQLKTLSERNADDRQLQGWRAMMALRRDDWKELLTAGVQKPREPMWVYVGQTNLIAYGDLSAVTDPCFLHAVALLNGGQPVLPRTCVDPEALAFFEWFNAPPARKQKAFDAFIRRTSRRVLQSHVAEQSYANGGIWDVSLDEPSGPAVTELILALPEARKFRVMVRDRLKL